MCTKKFLKVFGLLLVVVLLAAALPMQAKAEDSKTWTVCSDVCDYTTIQGAIDAASAGDTILVSGTFVHSGTATLNKDVTLTCATGAKIQVSGTGESFKLQAGASIEGCEIEKTDKTDQHNIITLEASGVAVKNNLIHGQWAIGDNEVSRAMVVYAGNNTDLEISGNEIWGLRQPAYISGTNTGTVSNNYVHGTKGWVIEGGNLTFSGNTFAGNVGDIAILSEVPAQYYKDILALSAANNNAVVEDQRVSPAVLSVAYVDASAAAGGNGTEASPYQSIQAGINRVIAGGTVHVAAGTYTEQVVINKGLTLLGANAGIHPAVGTHPTETVGTRAPESILSNNFAIRPAADDITVDGFKFTGAGGRIIDTYADANNFHLTNCIFDNPTTGVSQGVIQFGGGSHTDMLIDYNLFQDQGYHTIYTGGGPFDRMRIAYNKFNGLGNGVFWTATPLVDGIVEGNEFDGTIGGTPGQGGTGLNIGQGGNIIIRDNWFHDMSYTGFQVGIVGGSVINNTFEDTYPLYSGDIWYPSNAFELWGGEWGTSVSTDVTISGNTIKFNDHSNNNVDEHGIRLRAGADAPNIHINGNNFVDGGVSATALAVRNQGTGIVDATNNWWGCNADPGGTGCDIVSSNVAYSPWLGAPVGTVPMTFMVDDVGPKPAAGYIQTAINAASAGDTVNVAAGEYNENVDVTKAVTLLGPNAGTPGKGTRVAEAIIQGTSASWVSLYVEPNVPGVTIDGFTFDGSNLTPNGYAVGIAGNSSDLTVQNNIFVNHSDIAIMTSGVYYDGGWKYDKYLTDVLIKDNLITNTNLSTSGYNFGIYLQSSLGNVTGNVVTNMRNGIQVQPYWNTPGGGVVSGNKFTAYRTGIYFNYTQNATADWEFSGNQIEGIAYPSGLDPDRFNAIRVETFSAGKVEFSHNQVLLGATNATGQYQYYESNVTGGISIATPNWWGSILGPTALKYSGEAEFAPWCGDADCSFLVSAAEPEEDGFYVKDGKLFIKGNVNVPGGIEINEPGLTVVLEDGAVIQNESPCFTVNADNVTITSATLVGGKCVPTNNSDGIVVNALQGLRIVGIEITGKDPDTGANLLTGDGIHFIGAINNFQIVNNYIHDLDGDGIEFGGAVTNNQGIQGNLFLANGGLAIRSGVAVNAKYNSWGTNADPGLTNVDANPWTHVDLYMQSTDQDWPNKVAKYQQISYTVYGNFQNVMGADFVLEYPKGLLACLDCSEPTSGNPVPEGAFDNETITVDATAGKIHYVGYNTTSGAKSGTAVELFTVTFKANAAGTGVLNLVEDTDLFSMAPAGEPAPSNNIYAAALVDGSVTVIDIFDVTGIFSMQGRVFRGEIPVTLTSTDVNFPYGPWTKNSLDVLGINWNLGSVPVGEYLITTNQPRYLNVTAGLGAKIDVSTLQVITPLELKAGNVVDSGVGVTPNIIDTSDAGFIGGAYGASGDPLQLLADANFDGTVNIQDLALVGSNYGFTSATAYVGWMGITNP